MTTATIFVYPERQQEGLPCFDVRFDTQRLPFEVFVVGFLTLNENSELQEVVAPIYTTAVYRNELQETNFQTALEYARAVLRDDPKRAFLEEALDEQLSS